MTSDERRQNKAPLVPVSQPICSRFAVFDQVVFALIRGENEGLGAPGSVLFSRNASGVRWCSGIVGFRLSR